MELYQLQKVKYYLIVDPQFNKMEIYSLNNNFVYEPVAIDPATYNFIFEDDCTIDVDFDTIWE